MVGPGGVEPPTSRLSGVRSNHLSYEPIPSGGWFVSSCGKKVKPLIFARIVIKF